MVGAGRHAPPCGLSATHGRCVSACSVRGPHRNFRRAPTDSPDRLNVPAFARGSRALRGARTCGPSSCLRRGGRRSEFIARPAPPTFSSPSPAGIYTARSPLTFVVLRLQRGFCNGAPRGLSRAGYRAGSTGHRLRQSPHRATGALRPTRGTLTPHNLTPACSGLAVLAADARR